MVDIDNLEAIANLDKSGMLQLISDSPKLLLEGLDYGWTVEPKEFGEIPPRVVIVGYGGSAISGDILRNRFYRESLIPIDICRSLELPAYVDEETLVICASYSGETEETLELLERANRVRAKIVAVTSGGIMARFCEKFSLPMIKVRGGIPPRAALPLLLSAFATILSSFNIIKEMQGEIVQTVKELRDQVNRLEPKVNSSMNASKNLALTLLGAIPTVYSLERMSSVARRLKDQFNENSKIPAKYDLVPEVCHNEIEGWTINWLTEDSSGFPIILIRESKESQEETLRMNLLKQRLEKVKARIFEIKTEAETALGRLLLPINFGDYISTYLALARGIDPTPVIALDEFKAELEARTHKKERWKQELSS